MSDNFIAHLNYRDEQRLVDELAASIEKIRLLPAFADRYQILDALNATASDLLGDYHEKKYGG